MHRKLRELLKTATGVSQFVVAINADIRGFSSFAKLAESSETAIYLARVYSRIVDDYFSDAAFFKPTGDGLLLILTYESDGLAHVLQHAVERSLALVSAFPEICAKDPMINFDTPRKLGIGIARGAATRLQAGKHALDYSGKPLNLASRLMDLARPSGVVFDASLGHEVLSSSIRERFRSDAVFIRGIADEEPATIYHSVDVAISDDLKKSPAVRLFVEEPLNISFKDVEARVPRFLHYLSHAPSDVKSIVVRATAPSVLSSGKQQKGISKTFQFTHFTYEEIRGKPVVRIDYEKLRDRLRDDFKTRSNWPVSIDIEYRTRR